MVILQQCLIASVKVSPTGFRLYHRFMMVLSKSLDFRGFIIKIVLKWLKHLISSVDAITYRNAKERTNFTLKLLRFASEVYFELIRLLTNGFYLRSKIIGLSA